MLKLLIHTSSCLVHLKPFSFSLHYALSLG